MNRQFTYSLNRLYDNSTQIGQLLQDNTYKYDNVGNIDSIRDNGRNHRIQTYKYDDANRLIGSDGSIMQEHSTAQPYGYESGYKYSLAGRLLNKYVDSKRLSTAMGPHIQYLPYGEPYINQRLSGYNERFTFTGKERDEETGYGYFGARYMDHELMTMWLSVDPLADKYPSISPYAYCAWNPVRLVDPDGRDIWEIDGEGRIVNYIKDKTKDAFYRVDETGERMREDENSVEFEYGTIESHIERSYSYKNQTGTYDVFQVRGDDNGKKLFEFLANTVADKKMEVSHIKCGVAGNSGLNFVSTGHFKPVIETRVDGSVRQIASEPSQSCLWNGRLQYGYTVREINHSHPMTKDPSRSDLIMANQIKEFYSSIKHAPVPSLNIYYVKDGQYYPY